MNFAKILFAALPVFLIVGAGYCTRIFGAVNDDSEKSIMKLIVNVLYPCFILSQVPGNQALQQFDVVASAIAAGFGLTVAALLIAKGIGHAMKLDPFDGINTFCVATAIQNYGFIPIPLIGALFGESATETLGVLFVHNLGLELAMWNEFIPTFASKAIHDVGQCSIPMGLLLAGATMAGVVQREKWKINPKVIFGSLAIRFAIMPAIFLAVASFVSFSPELRNVLLVEAAMPAAIFPIVLAKHFGGKPAIAVEVCVVTTVVSLLMTPLILLLALQWFGISIGG